MSKLSRLASELNPISILRAFKNKALQSGERNNVLYYYTSSFYPELVIKKATKHNQLTEPRFVKNFIGVKVRPEVMPSVLTSMIGSIEGPPAPGTWHADIAEFGAAFYAVDQSSGTFRMVELGCGWGCWMVNTGTYARSLKKKVVLVGIEGDPGHLANAEQTLKDNGFANDEFHLVNGVAGPKPGVALFPSLDTPGENWGAEPVFYPTSDERERLLKTGHYQELKCYPLAELAGGTTLDLLHIDIQGAEVDFIVGNFDDISHNVRRVLIGTHSRIIEGQLMKHFLDKEWALEMDRPVISEVVAGRPDVRIDGVQMWKNPSL